MTKAHHHHGHHDHHNHLHHDKHNGVDQLCFLFLGLCEGPVFSVTCSGNNSISHTQRSFKLHHWAFIPTELWGEVCCAPGALVGLREQDETFAPALPTIAGNREPGRKLWGGRLPASSRNTQLSQTAAHIYCDVKAGSGILQRYRSSSSRRLLTSACAMETPSPPKL